MKYVDPDGKQAKNVVIRANPNVKTEFLSFNDMVKLWDINNKKYNYSKSLQGIFGIGQAAFDNSLMVSDAFDLFSGIAKDIFNVVGDVSTIVGLVTALMPDSKGEIKQKWDSFLASYSYLRRNSKGIKLNKYMIFCKNCCIMYYMEVKNAGDCKRTL